MKVVHISWSPVAGSPARIVKALNTYTDCSARHITLEVNAYGNRTFENDLNWKQDRDECISCLRDADVLHIHQWISLDDFFDDDLRILSKKISVRQFHSIPLFLAHQDPIQEQHIINDPMPQLVIAQYPYCFYPHARAVPNIVEDPVDIITTETADKLPHIAFSPSLLTGAWEDRWVTKAAPEIISVLLALEKKNLCTVDIITDMPHHECMRRKEKADIIIDDLVTGSYHLSGLEGLALGKVVFGWLDNQIQSLLYRFTGAPYLPWVNVHLEDFSRVLEEVVQNREMLNGIKQCSRDWFLRWYHPKDMVQYYVQAYADLLQAPAAFQTLRPTSPEADYLLKDIPDLLWSVRKERYTGKRISVAATADSVWQKLVTLGKTIRRTR